MPESQPIPTAAAALPAAPPVATPPAAAPPPMQPPPPEEPQQVDPLLQLWKDTGAERDRLRQMTPSLQGLQRQLVDTVMSLLQDLCSFQLQQRQWVAHSLGDVDQRLMLVELNDDGALAGEEVQLLLEFIGGAMGVIEKSIEAPGQSTEAKEMLTKLRELGGKCIELVTEAGPDDDDDDDELPVEPPPAAAGNGVPG